MFACRSKNEENLDHDKIKLGGGDKVLKTNSPTNTHWGKNPQFIQKIHYLKFLILTKIHNFKV